MARKKSKKRKLTERVVTTRDRYTFASLLASTFRELNIGQHFRFTDDRTNRPYGPAVKKVSANCYVRAIKDVTPRGRVRATMQPICFRAVSAGVVPTGRTSPVRKRRGRGRGSAVLSGLRRRSRR
jgi:hypothetical protein